MAKSSKIGFKQSAEAYSNIITDIKQKKYAGTYLLMGEEPFFIDAISNYIGRNILNEEERSFNQHILYGKDCSGSEIVDLARGYPMLGAMSVVIIKEAQQVSSIENLTHYYKMPQKSTILVLCYKGSLDKRSQLYKRISENGVVFESVTPRDYEISSWVYDLFRSKGKTINPSAATMLVDNLGTELSKIDNEVDKLITSISVDKKEITAEDIEANIGISKDFNNFELTKALSERNVKKAMLIADHFARNPADNPIFVTLPVIFNHFLRIFTLGIIMWNTKKKGTQLPSEFELIKELKLSNAYFLKEYQMAVKSYGSGKSFVILGYIREYDLKSKGSNGGSASGGDLLKELILKILSI